MEDKRLNGRMFRCEQIFCYMDNMTDPDDPGLVVRFVLDKEMVIVPLSNCKLA